jgi:hypothetical protein
VDDHDLVLFRELDHFVEELRRRARARRVVRIVKDEHFGLGENVGGDAFQVGQEVVFLEQRQVVDDSAVILRVGAEDRVARYGHQDHVARIDQRGGQDGKRRLAADGVDDLRLRVHRHAAHLAQVFGRRLLQDGVAIVRIAAVLRLARLGVERLDDARIGHRVRLAHAQVKQLRLRMRLDRRALGPLDLLELIDGRVLAIPRPADSLGEQSLDEAFLHSFSKVAATLRLAML